MQPQDERDRIEWQAMRSSVRPGEGKQTGMQNEKGSGGKEAATREMMTSADLGVTAVLGAKAAQSDLGAVAGGWLRSAVGDDDLDVAGVAVRGRGGGCGGEGGSSRAAS